MTQPPIFPEPEWEIVIHHHLTNKQCDFRQPYPLRHGIVLRPGEVWGCYYPDRPAGTPCLEENCMKEITFQE